MFEWGLPLIGKIVFFGLSAESWCHGHEYLHGVVNLKGSPCCTVFQTPPPPSPLPTCPSRCEGMTETAERPWYACFWRWFRLFTKLCTRLPLVDLVIARLGDKRNAVYIHEHVSLQSHHLRCLHDLIEAQMTYYAQAHQYMSDLQKQLGR